MLRIVGFNFFDIGSMREGMIVFILLLMFIGVGSVLIVSGIKLIMFIVILMFVIVYLWGKKEMVIFCCFIKYLIIIKVLVVSVIGLFFVFLGIFVLMVIE